jgi:hypothetical protein
MYATIGRLALVPLELRNKMLKSQVNRQMIRLAPKPQEVYNNQK